MPRHIPLNTNIPSKNTSFTFYLYGEILAEIDKFADKNRISRSELLRVILTDYLREEGDVRITSEDVITNTPQSAANPLRREAIPGKRNEIKMVLPLTLAIKFDEFAKRVGRTKSVIMSFAINIFLVREKISPLAPRIHL